MRMPDRQPKRPAGPRGAPSGSLPTHNGGSVKHALWSLLHLAGAAIFLALMLARMAQADPPRAPLFIPVPANAVLG